MGSEPAFNAACIEVDNENSAAKALQLCMQVALVGVGWCLDCGAAKGASGRSISATLCGPTLTRIWPPELQTVEMVLSIMVFFATVGQGMAAAAACTFVCACQLAPLQLVLAEHLHTCSECTASHASAMPFSLIHPLKHARCASS